MKEEVVSVNYIIDGVISVIPTKMIYEQSCEEEIQYIQYELSYEDKNIISKSSSMIEFAVISLQRALPSNVKIACCQSCRHGSFCPFGDMENEIFCLKDVSPNNKAEVCDIFSKEINSLNKRSRKLLDFCTDYKPLTSEYYTYNDWDYQTTKNI